MSGAAVRLEVEAAETFLAGLFGHAGLDAASAATMASALIAADVQGLPSHGLMQAPMYLKRLQLGSISTAARGEVVVDAEAIAVIDAAGMFGHLVGDQAMTLAIERSKRFGAGVVAVRDAFHFGAAGRYARQASASDCIGISLCNTRPLMPAPGGIEAAVGNNPVAIGIPAEAQSGFLLDMALSEVALGRIRLAALAGETIPETWALDAAGQPTSDPREAMAGLLLPAGGAKGFGLALAVDLMASLLSGGPGGHDVGPMYGDLGVPFRCSLLFLAIDIAHFADPGIVRALAAATLARIREGRSLDGRALHTPGSGRAMQADTVEVARETADALKTIAAEFNLLDSYPTT